MTDPMTGESLPVNQEKTNSGFLGYVTVWLSPSEMEWLEMKGKVRIERDVIVRPAGFVQAYSVGGSDD